MIFLRFLLIQAFVVSSMCFQFLPPELMAPLTAPIGLVVGQCISVMLQQCNIGVSNQRQLDFFQQLVQDNMKLNSKIPYYFPQKVK